MIQIIFFNQISSFFHPLDQFEIIALFFYWSGAVTPVGPTVITNLIIIFFFNVVLFRILFAGVFDRGTFNVWEFLLNARNDAVKTIVPSNTWLKRLQYVSLFFSFILLYFNSKHGAQDQLNTEFVYAYEYNYQLIFSYLYLASNMVVMMMGNNNNHQKSDTKENASNTEDIQKMGKKEESLFTWENVFFVSIGVGLGVVVVVVVICLFDGGTPPSSSAPRPAPIPLTPIFTPIPRIDFDFVLPGNIPLHRRLMRPLTYTEIFTEMMNTVAHIRTNGRRP